MADRRPRYPRSVPCGKRVAKLKRFRHMAHCRRCQQLHVAIGLGLLSSLVSKYMPALLDVPALDRRDYLNFEALRTPKGAK